jgi:magnesium-protoporphyrin O-methyltransferase
MASSYLERREQVELYFDRTAVEAWKRLTSNAPVGGIRATVRAGREAMRRNLLNWLPADLRGRRILDAGCGTGALAVEAARRGASVVAIDLSPSLVAIARERMPADLGRGRIEFLVGDMLNPRLGGFDHVVAMDSLIHYQVEDTVRVLGGLSALALDSVLFTFVPRTPALALMHTVGRLFPRGNRAPSVEPVDESVLRARLDGESGLAGWRAARAERVSSGFYTSHGVELVRR